MQNLFISKRLSFYIFLQIREDRITSSDGAREGRFITKTNRVPFLICLSAFVLWSRTIYSKLARSSSTRIRSCTGGKGKSMWLPNCTTRNIRSLISSKLLTCLLYLVFLSETRRSWASSPLILNIMNLHNPREKISAKSINNHNIGITLFIFIEEFEIILHSPCILPTFSASKWVAFPKRDLHSRYRIWPTLCALKPLWSTLPRT